MQHYAVTLASRLMEPERWSRKDAARVWMEPDGDGLICALADGSETGWDVGCARLGTLVLDALEEVVVLDAPSLFFRMERAFMRADRRLRERAARVDPETPDVGWRATAAALYLSEGFAHLCWAGSDAAVLVRRGRIIARTHPDVLGARFMHEGASLDDVGDDPRNWITTATLPFSDDAELNWDEPWPLEPGDVLVLASAHFWMQTPENALVHILSQHPTLDAENLLDAMPDPHPPTHLIVARVLAGTGRPQ